MPDPDIISYYDKLAPDYDADRFANSYGHFIDRQERRCLEKILAGTKGAILDLGCGTGRLNDWATHGADGSEAMLSKAREKFPNKNFSCCDIASTPFTGAAFEAVYSFHVFMHLDAAKTDAAFNEVSRILKKDGLFIFDFPTAKRRKLINAGTSGWHGNTAYTISDLEKKLQHNFILVKSYGILFLPIQRFPKWSRKYLFGIDNILCRMFPGYASYNVGVFRRR